MNKCRWRKCFYGEKLLSYSLWKARKNCNFGKIWHKFLIHLHPTWDPTIHSFHQTWKLGQNNPWRIAVSTSTSQPQISFDWIFGQVPKAFRNFEMLFNGWIITNNVIDLACYKNCLLLYTWSRNQYKPTFYLVTHDNNDIFCNHAFPHSIPRISITFKECIKKPTIFHFPGDIGMVIFKQLCVSSDLPLTKM